ncbi:hypothetical protein CL655_02685 [bacterium]|nr:hypothetical protein [bacterium]|tara:strand:+ start:151 stop:468 length:318 start_codon:yes stop_codon:yes gene_type:complete
MSPLCKQIHKEKRYAMLAGGLLLFLVVGYMYGVCLTVMHVVVRKETSQSMAELNSQVAALEAEYISAQHAVSARVALLPGFVETPEKIFIDRSETTLVVRDRLLP